MKRFIAIILSIALIAGGCIITGNYSDDPYTYYPEYIDISEGKYPVDFNFEALYADEDAWLADYDLLLKKLPDLQKYKGKLNSAQAIYDYFQEEMYGEASQLIEKLAAYAYFGNSVYPSDPMFRRMSVKIDSAYEEFDKNIAYVDREILEIPYEERIQIFEDPLLAQYENVFNYLLEEDSAALTDEELQESINSTLASGRMYSLFDIFAYSQLPNPEYWLSNNEFVYLDGTVVEEISRGDYDRDIKIDAYETWWGNVSDYADTFAYILETQMLEFYSDALLSGYDTTEEYILDEYELPTDIINNIIDVVHDALPLAIEMFEKHGLTDGADQYYIFDTYGTLSEYKPPYISYDDAVDNCIASLQKLGDEYVDAFIEIANSGCIDVYPKENKTESAFQMAGYLNIYPMIMYNYTGTVEDAITVAHEMGHSVYSLFSARNQDYCYDSPGTFMQEIASVVNELNYLNYKRETALTDEERLYYLEYEINDILILIFREVMYQEFENYCYSVIESGDYLDSYDLSEKYAELSKQYYGEHFTLGDYGAYRWATIPHYYSNHYVFQYAVDACYAIYILNEIYNGNEEMLNNYIEMLKLGNSLPPEDLLKVIGIDIDSKQPFIDAMSYIEGLINEFETLSAELGK